MRAISVPGLTAVPTSTASLMSRPPARDLTSTVVSGWTTPLASTASVTSPLSAVAVRYWVRLEAFAFWNCRYVTVPPSPRATAAVRRKVLRLVISLAGPYFTR